MFGKLLKYEFNAVKKTLLTLLLVMVGAGILGGGLMWLTTSIAADAGPEDVIGMIASITTCVGCIIAVIGCTIGASIILWLRFYRSRFSDQGYLTFTLPVTTHQILLSSILNNVIWNILFGIGLLISYFGIFAPLFAALYRELGVDLPVLLSQLRQMASMYEWYAFLIWGFEILGAWAYSIVMPLLCITIGCQVAKKHKLLASFGVYYGLTMVISIIAGIITGLSATGAVLSGAGSTAFYLMYAIPYILYMAIGIGGYFIMHHFADNKLNLA